MLKGYNNEAMVPWGSVRFILNQIWDKYMGGFRGDMSILPPDLPPPPITLPRAFD